MENKAEDSVCERMESLRIVREKEIAVQQQKMESFADSFRKSLESITARSRENARSQGEPSILFKLFGKEVDAIPLYCGEFNNVIGTRIVCEVTDRVLRLVAYKTQKWM